VQTEVLHRASTLHPFFLDTKHNFSETRVGKVDFDLQTLGVVETHLSTQTEVQTEVLVVRGA
jgi:hypothetical protein